MDSSRFKIRPLAGILKSLRIRALQARDEAKIPWPPSVFPTTIIYRPIIIEAKAAREKPNHSDLVNVFGGFADLLRHTQHFLPTN